MTSGGQNIKSMNISHVRHQIMGFWCSDSIHFLTIDDPESRLPRNFNDTWRSKYKCNEISYDEVANQRLFGDLIPI